MHAEAWALISEYRDRPEWTQFLKECAIHDTKQQRKLHFEDYLIKVKIGYIRNCTSKLNYSYY